MPRILVVDDHVANCQPLAKLFRFAGVDAACAFSGPEALDLLAGTGPADLPDVILLDVMMPDMDGFAVLQRLRDDRRYDGVKVLMYTAVVDVDSHLRATQLGAQGYVLKGNGFDDVRTAVQGHLPAR